MGVFNWVGDKFVGHLSFKRVAEDVLGESATMKFCNNAKLYTVSNYLVRKKLYSLH